MTFLKRFRAVPVALAALSALAAIGTTLFGDMRPGADPVRPGRPPRPDGGQITEELATSKFSQLPVLTYQPRDGETVFAWQVRPAVAPAPARPRDVLVLVDTSASQAGLPLRQARQIISALAATLHENDRVSVWVANTPAATRSLTRGFFAPNSAEVRDAAASLTEVEYGAGATDLKNALNKALATIPPARNARQQLVLFLGDGESSFAPLTEDDRVALGQRMDALDVFFFAVPLGLKVNPQNLHGLAALTGGAVVRLQEDLGKPDRRSEFLARLYAALDAPVVKVEKFSFGDEVGEFYPTKLPPLRADRPTLVMGKIARPAAGSLTLAVNGTVANRPVTLDLSEKLPAPQIDHYFLNLMLHQWRDAPHKDAPAMLQSDRALALASTQIKLYRDEFLVQAVWAINQSQWDDAVRLFEAARKIDPNDKEAQAGLNLIEKLKSGQITRAELEKKIAARQPEPPAAERPADPPAANPPAANPPAARDALNEAAARRQIEEQRYKVLVDATIRRARQLLRTDPDGAYQDLKRQRDEILGYDGIGNNARSQMVADLESVMREIFVKGAEIKRQAAAEREAIAKTRQRLNEFDRLQDDEARTKYRLDQFRQLMHQARFELAYQEAQLLIQERVNKGQSIPPTAVASYIIGQQATQLREWRELIRIREDRYLLTMMQAEKSNIPYPDEPPVHFPPAAVWRELTALRRDAYLNSNLGPNPSPSQLELKNIIENKEALPEDPEGKLNPPDLNVTPLKELLKYLQLRHNISIIPNYKAFEADYMLKPDQVDELKVNVGSANLSGMKLGTFLDTVLLSVNATFIVRPDHIEITTFDRRLEEKVTRVFPVADLVIPIPSSVNIATLQQNLMFQNAQLAIFGQVIGAANFQGFGNAFAQNQGLQNFQGPGQPFGPAGGPFGNIGQPGANQGFGGGALSVGGGNLGQFGNLGGQFGLQGGDQSQLLLNLIVETVARGEWVQVTNPNAIPGMGEEQVPLLTANQLNSLGYYPPARALIIRGTSRYHPATSIKLKRQDGGAALGPMNPRVGGAVAAASNNNTEPKAKPDAVAAGSSKPTLKDPKLDPVALRKKLGNDPARMWNDAIDWTVTDPGLIVATAEFLMEMDEYRHAAEVLKGSLRKGLTTETWTHDALAIALQSAQASAEEVERAMLSGIDLEPTNPKAYLKAAKAEADLKNHAQAVAFCKRAAELAPDQPLPYANALAYAERANDLRTDAVVWAVHNLMKRDWNTADGVNYHEEVKSRLPGLIAKAQKAGQDTTPFRKALVEQTQRDLVIELLWQGAADLDLVVTEPCGSVCSATQKRTTGGGVLRCDILEQGNDRAEVYTAALAFKGTYKVTVKAAFGKPIGGTATLKITKYKGTPREAHDLLTVNLNDPKSIEVVLEHGSRTELAVISNDTEDYRAETTAAPLALGRLGIGGGFGTLAAGPQIATPDALPVVNTVTESRLPGIGAAADLRAAMKFNPDRQSVTFHVNPVFGTGKPVTLPKVPLLPGGE